MNKLIIVMDKGLCQGTFYEGDPNDIQIEIWDHDIEGADDDRLTTIAGATVYITEEEVHPISNLFAYQELKEKGKINSSVISKIDLEKNPPKVY